jgi:hypothetical protein
VTRLPRLNRFVNRVAAGRNRFELVVNLDEMFGTAFPNSSRLRQLIGQEILDTIVRRTQNNRAWDGKQFKSYSDEYAESLDFQAAGKSKGDPNLTLTGDMLGLMDVIEESKATITIGWTSAEEAEKAHGHITGNVGVKRDFFGLNESEVKAIREKFEDQIREATADTGPARSSVERLGNIIEGTAPIQSQTLGSLLTELFGDDNG